jgi:excisionase family DNA binding protein
MRQQNNLITTSEAAEILNVTVRTVERWCVSGKLPAQRTSGGWWVIRREDVERLQQEKTPGS